MSSEASTNANIRMKPDSPATTPVDQSLQPWQFFVLAALACATAVTFLVRGQGLTVVILLTVLMATTALVAMAMLRTVRPLVSPHDDRTAMVGERTRAALEREKLLTLRSLKELEFDRAMGKVSDEDFRDMTSRLRARAMRLMRQLDAGNYEAAFLLRPTPVEQVREVAAAGGTMPPKSTYFFPKLLTGIAFNPLS